MTFDENGICVLESITTVEECCAYESFLSLERERHRRARNYAAAVANDKEGVARRYGAEGEFWRSAVNRHEDDIAAVDRRTFEIEAHKAKLEGK
jgi:hypothetical protein